MAKRNMNIEIFTKAESKEFIKRETQKALHDLKVELGAEIDTLRIKAKRQEEEIKSLNYLVSRMEKQIISLEVSQR